MTEVQDLARVVDAADIESVSPEALDQLKIRGLDTLGVAIGALDAEPVVAIRGTAAAFLSALVVAHQVHTRLSDVAPFRTGDPARGQQGREPALLGDLGVGQPLPVRQVPRAGDAQGVVGRPRPCG